MKTRFFLLLIPILICLTACSAKGGDVFAFADSDAAFTLTFTSDVGEIVCECTRVGEHVRAEVISPERSRGIVISTGVAGTQISVDGVDIPLSEDAARGFCMIFEVMFRGSDGAEVRMSEDGEYTEAVYEDGVLTIDSEGKPASVDVGRVVKISNYTAQK